MKTILCIIVLAVSLAAQAAAPPRGPARLRELAVFPKMNLGFTFGFNFRNNTFTLNEDASLPDQIAQVQNELKRRPDDIEQLEELAELLQDNGETNESQSCYQKADKLAENKVAESPRNGLFLINLGVAQNALNQVVEAEMTFRKAVLVSSNQWQCWTGLGNFLAGQSASTLFPDTLRYQAAPSAQTPSPAVLGYRPSPAALKKSEALGHEASECFNRAITIAPTEPRVYLQRCGYFYMSIWQNCFYQHYRDNQTISPHQWLLAYMPDEMIADLQKAADLTPKDYQLTAMAVYFSYAKALALAPPHANTAFSAEMLPDSSRRLVEEALARLDRLSQDPDKRIAAGASEYLGLLDIVSGHKQTAVERFRRSIALDPSRSGAWDMLLASLLGSASADELCSICESRLKYQDSARNHLLLAKMYAQKAHQFKEAARQAQMAATLETNNTVAPLILAAIALNDSVDTNALANAYTELTRASDLISRSPPNDDTAERWRESMLDRAILDGLVGTPEFLKGARDLIDAVLRHFPDDPDAKDIREALVN